MITGQQQQIVTVTLAMRVYRASPDVYCIHNRAEHTTLCALEKRGLVAYAGDAVPDNGFSTWTATEALQDRIAALVAGDDDADADVPEKCDHEWEQVSTDPNYSVRVCIFCHTERSVDLRNGNVKEYPSTRSAPQPVTVTLDDIDWFNLEELAKHLNYSTEFHSIVTRLDKLVACGYADNINRRYWITANGRTALGDHNAKIAAQSTTLRFAVGDHVIMTNARPGYLKLDDVWVVDRVLNDNAHENYLIVSLAHPQSTGAFVLDSELSPAPPPITVQLAHPFANGTKIRVKIGYRDWLRSKPGSVVIDNYEAGDGDRLTVTGYNGDADWYICTSDGMDVMFVPTEWVELE